MSAGWSHWRYKTRCWPWLFNKAWVLWAPCRCRLIISESSAYPIWNQICRTDKIPQGKERENGDGQEFKEVEEETCGFLLGRRTWSPSKTFIEEIIARHLQLPQLDNGCYPAACSHTEQMVNLFIRHICLLNPEDGARNECYGAWW